MPTLDAGIINNNYWNSQNKIDTVSDTARQLQAEQDALYARGLAQQQAAGNYVGNDPVAAPSPAVFGAGPGGVPKAPAPPTGIIAGAQGVASFGPGSTAAPAPGGLEVTKPLAVGAAPGTPSFGPGSTGAPAATPAPGASFGPTGAAAPAPANPSAVKTALSGLQWAGQGKDAASAKAMFDQAIANKWSLDDLGAGNGTNGDWWKSLFQQYNLSWPAATPGQPGTPGAPGTPGGSGGGIISGSTKSAAQLGTPTDWNVTPEQTVEGRIAAIIGDKNNPIQQIARTNALEEANSRGLANSSMAVSAGERAAFEAAMPIATADAATFAKAAGYNADQKNQFARENVNSENQFRIQGMNNDAQRDLALINRDTQLQLSKFNSEQQQLAAKLELDNQKLLQTNGKAAEAFNQAMAAINNVNMNDKMDADTKTRTVASIWRDTQLQLNTLGRVAGLDLTSDLDFANMPGFSDKGLYVGFEDGAGAVTRAAGPGGIISGAQNGPATFPSSVSGKPVNWDQPDNLGKTPRNYYNDYKAAGGTLTPELWLLYGGGAGTSGAGGPGNDSSSPNANSSSVGNTGGDSSAASA
jgi:hypothetical protein